MSSLRKLCQVFKTRTNLYTKCIYDERRNDFFFSSTDLIGNHLFPIYDVQFNRQPLSLFAHDLEFLSPDTESVYRVYNVYVFLCIYGLIAPCTCTNYGRIFRVIYQFCVVLFFLRYIRFSHFYTYTDMPCQHILDIVKPNARLYMFSFFLF